MSLALMPTARSIVNLRKANARLTLGGLPLESSGRIGLYLETRRLNSRLNTTFRASDIAMTLRFLSYNLRETDLNGAVIDVSIPASSVKDISRGRIDALSSRPMPEGVISRKEISELPDIEVLEDLNPSEVKKYVIRNDHVVTDLASMLFPASKTGKLAALLAAEIGPSRSLANIVERIFPMGKDMLSLTMRSEFEVNHQWLSVIDRIRSNSGGPVNLLILSQLDRKIILSLLENEGFLKMLARAGVKKITVCANKILSDREGSLVFKGRSASFDIAPSSIRAFLSHGTIVLTASPVLSLLKKTNNILDLRETAVAGHENAVDGAWSLFLVSRDSRRLFFQQPGQPAVSYTRIESGNSIDPTTFPLGRRKMITVLVPTCNGVNRIERTLQSIIADLKKLPEDCVWEIMVCVNGTNDGTLRVLEKFMITHPDAALTILAIPKRLSSPGLVTSENLLQREAYQKYRALRERQGDISSFIHVSDDDITLPVRGDRSAIGENVRLLTDSPGLLAVSGHYVVGEAPMQDEESSSLLSRLIARVNASRKYAVFVSAVPQLYGGAMTMSTKNWPASGVDVNAGATDCWLSIHFWQRAIDELGLDALLQNIADLGSDGYPVRSNPYVPVEHPVPATLKGTLRRMIRDLYFGRLARSAGSRAAVELFESLREDDFSRVTRRVKSLSPFDPIRIAHVGNTLIFKVASWLDRSDARRSLLIPNLKSFFRDDIALPAFEAEAEADVPLKNLPLFERYRALMGRAREIYEFMLERSIVLGTVENADRLSDLQLLKAIESMLIVELGADLQDIKKLSSDNEAAHEFIGLLQEVYQQRENLLNPSFIKSLFRKAGINLKGKVEVSRVLSTGRVNLIFFVKAGGESYFVRYLDPVGLDFPPLLPEKAARLATVIAENIFSELLDRRRVVTSIYPDVSGAKRQFLERPSDQESRLLSRMMIQKDLKGEFSLLRDFISGKEAFQGNVFDLASSYAALIGDLHNSSWGMRNPSVRREMGERTPTLSVLEEVIKLGDPELVRNVDVGEYANWLKHKWWRLSNLRKLLKRNGAPATAHPLSRKLFSSLSSKISFPRELNLAITDSIRALEEHGSLGHLDYSPKNTFRSRDRDLIKMFDFEFLGFVDPAVDASVALYRFLLDRIAHGSDPLELDEALRIIDSFMGSYKKAIGSRGEADAVAGRILKLTKLLLCSAGEDLEKRAGEETLKLIPDLILKIHDMEESLDSRRRGSSELSETLHKIKQLLRSGNYPAILDLIRISDKGDIAQMLAADLGHAGAIDVFERLISATPKASDRLMAHDIIETIISSLMSELGFETADIYDVFPDVKKMVNLAQSSRAHEGRSAASHTVKLLSLLNIVRRRSGGEEEIDLPAELLGTNKFLGLEPVKALENMVNLIGSRRLNEMAKSNPALNGIAEASKSTESMRQYTAEAKDAKNMLNALWYAYSRDFLEFLADIYSRVENKDFLAVCALLHDIGKIEDDTYHTHKEDLVERITRNSLGAARRENFDDFVRIARAVVRYHVLFGSVPLKEEGYDYYGRINDLMGSRGSQEELYNILTLISILDVAATGSKGLLFVPGMDDMKRLYENYMEALGGKSWSDITSREMFHGYGFSRMLSFVGEDKRDELDGAMRMVPRKELSDFWVVLNRMGRFTQFFFKLKNFQAVRNVVRLFLLIKRVAVASSRNDLTINVVHIKIKDMAAFEDALAKIEIKNSFLQDEVDSSLRDAVNAHPEAESYELAAGNVKFVISPAEGDLTIKMRDQA